MATSSCTCDCPTDTLYYIIYEFTVKKYNLYKVVNSCRSSNNYKSILLTL